MGGRQESAAKLAREGAGARDERASVARQDSGAGLRRVPSRLRSSLGAREREGGTHTAARRRSLLGSAGGWRPTTRTTTSRSSATLAGSPCSEAARCCPSARSTRWRARAASSAARSAAARCPRRRRAARAQASRPGGSSSGRLGSRAGELARAARQGVGVGTSAVLSCRVVRAVGRAAQCGRRERGSGPLLLSSSSPHGTDRPGGANRIGFSSPRTRGAEARLKDRSTAVHNVYAFARTCSWRLSQGEHKRGGQGLTSLGTGSCTPASPLRTRASARLPRRAHRTRRRATRRLRASKRGPESAMWPKGERDASRGRASRRGRRAEARRACRRPSWNDDDEGAETGRRRAVRTGHLLRVGLERDGRLEVDHLGPRRVLCGPDEASCT